MNQNLCASLGERQRGRAAYAAGSAGNKSGLA
jgi:hypothetical protein